jgi:hypothetical protein
MNYPLRDMGRGEPESYESPAQVAGDLNVSLLGALPRCESVHTPPFALADLVDPDSTYDAIVDRIELLCGQMPVKLLGCLGLEEDALRYRLAANLGLARTGRSITVVEAELRRPMLAVDPSRREGVIDMILYGCSYSVVARESGIQGVKVVTAGSHPWSGEPIHGDEWERVLGTFRQHSDLTLLTATTATPAPVLSMLARRLDSILITYRLHATGRDAIRRSYLTLWDMDAPIIGLIAEGQHPATSAPSPEEGRAGAAVAEAVPPRERTIEQVEGAVPPVVDLGLEGPGADAAQPQTADDDWSSRFWEPTGAAEVPGFDDAEVVIRETREIEESTTSRWQEEVSRMRAAAAPPSDAAPFADEVPPPRLTPETIEQSLEANSEPPAATGPADRAEPIAEPVDEPRGLERGGVLGDLEPEPADQVAEPARDTDPGGLEIEIERVDLGIEPVTQQSADQPGNDTGGEGALSDDDFDAAWDQLTRAAPDFDSPAIERTPEEITPEEITPEPELASPEMIEVAPQAEAAPDEPMPELAPLDIAPIEPIEPIEPMEPIHEAEHEEWEVAAEAPMEAEIAATGEAGKAVETAEETEIMAASGAAWEPPQRAPEPDETGILPASAEREETEDSPKVAEEVTGPNRTPWRVLVIGSLIGVATVLFWAYKNDVIRFEERPPRSATSGLQQSATLSPQGTDLAALVGGDGAGDGVTPGESAEGAAAPGPGGSAESSDSKQPADLSRAGVAGQLPSAAGASGTQSTTARPPATPAKPPTTAQPPATAPRPAGPEPTSPAVPSKSAAEIKPGQTAYGVHVSSFRAQKLASTDLASYEKIGYRGLIVTVKIPGRGDWKRVMLGPYPTLKEARRVAKAIREDGLSPEAMIRKIAPEER